MREKKPGSDRDELRRLRKKLRKLHGAMNLIRDELRKRLEAALELFLKPGVQPDGAPNDQAGAVEYLKAIADFVEAHGIEPPLLRPGREIKGAFDNAVEGICPHLFRKRPKGGKRPRSIDRKAFLVVASVAVTRLLEVDDFEGEDAACRYAVNKLPGFRFGKPATPAWRSLRDDREKVMSGRMGDEALEFYKRLLRDTDPTPPRGAAEAL